MTEENIKKRYYITYVYTKNEGVCFGRIFSRDVPAVTGDVIYDWQASAAKVEGVDYFNVVVTNWKEIE